MIGFSVPKSAAYEVLVEQTAEAMWTATYGGDVRGWKGAPETTRELFRHQARAALKVLGHVDVSAEARLFGYRCEALKGYAANREELLREWTLANLAVDVTTLPFADWLASKADAIAHAQLARETEVNLTPLERIALAAAKTADQIGSKYSTQYGGLPSEVDLDDDIHRVLRRSVAGVHGEARQEGLAELAALVVLAIFLCDCKEAT